MPLLALASQRRNIPKIPLSFAAIAWVFLCFARQHFGLAAELYIPRGLVSTASLLPSTPAERKSHFPQNWQSCLPAHIFEFSH